MYTLSFKSVNSALIYQSFVIFIRTGLLISLRKKNILVSKKYLDKYIFEKSYYNRAKLPISGLVRLYFSFKDGAGLTFCHACLTD